MSNNAAPHSPSTSVDPVLNWLRILSGVAALLAVVQTLLGLGVLGNLGGVFPIHEGIGYLVLLATIAAAVFAVLWSQRSGNKGMMMHAITVAVLALIQIGVAQMGVVWLHVIIGVLILVASIALFTLSMRKAGASRAQRRPSTPQA